jgi:hypothetical protein
MINGYYVVAAHPTAVGLTDINFNWNSVNYYDFDVTDDNQKNDAADMGIEPSTTDPYSIMNPNAWAFSGSNDGSTWTRLDS